MEDSAFIKKLVGIGFTLKCTFVTAQLLPALSRDEWCFGGGE